MMTLPEKGDDGSAAFAWDFVISSGLRGFSAPIRKHAYRRFRCAYMKPESSSRA